MSYPFNIHLRGSHPSDLQDDIFATNEYMSYEDAYKAFSNPESVFETWELDGVQYIEMVNIDDDIQEVREVNYTELENLI